MTVSVIDLTRDVNCRRGKVYTGNLAQTWTPHFVECDAAMPDPSSRFSETDYYCCGSGGGTTSTTIVNNEYTTVNEGDVYEVTNIIQLSGSGGGGYTYIELGQSNTLLADTSGDLTGAFKVPAPSTMDFTIVDGVATLGSSGSTDTYIDLYITDQTGTTGAPISFNIPPGATHFVIPGVIGQVVPASGYIQQNIVSAGTGAADLIIGLYGTLS